MIETENLSVDLAGRTILSGIGFAAPAGKLTAIIGPNGSGKSTLLKAISRDYRYTGTVRINGRNLADMSAMETACQRAVLPQSSTLPFPFTVREVVAMGTTAGRPGPSGEALRSLPERALARVDLADFGGRYYGELSGGEQQRVQLARVLCQVWQPVLDGLPRFLLLDEPVSSLDVKHQLMIMDTARSHADAGGGVIAVLHDLNLAAMYADHIVALANGRLVAAGTPAEVLTDSTILSVFDAPLRVGVVPTADAPFVLPQSAQHTSLQSRVA
ncbi:MAG: heme ABC transporter ATP-binding protein [Candidatus Devosia phytovorans]|uniref:Heme ABC transporter ATP-binding protein n=1 Tax=Candidatus Devosia phytovorans TaxID=3121372 RepID=A0AAJ5VYZ6_9HYPH|nr:heme ABC transporter ATP-binding protein [Devosia sp.]WEK06465.1 MAG: heme ABC transporter ATP-binding protein [Devosia sp.]